MNIAPSKSTESISRMTEAQRLNVLKLINALRSEEYNFGTCALRQSVASLTGSPDRLTKDQMRDIHGIWDTTKDCFCALGVACDLYDPNLWLRHDDAHVITVPTGTYAYISQEWTGGIPLPVRNHYGIRESNGRFELSRIEPDAAKRIFSSGRYYSTLVTINDSTQGAAPSNGAPLKPNQGHLDVAALLEYCLDHPETRLFI